MKNLDSRIADLEPGRSIEISKSGDVTVSVERSGNGKEIRFVRQTKNGFEVFKKSKF